ncbi:type VI secretion system protein TssA [Geobacter pickeringii]|uniref:Type VI secretion protein n=1 Tax=Geobacter pickeringii TaxID=345632 RepID=A0A0B5B6Y7_9BACT|nr:type VI secretion system protein TssA [Geobacter pickeringii]AJE02302.1 type VI secretion protein [Geobacter pickeringii]
MIGSTDHGTAWRWSAFGKHPAAADYFRLGEGSPFVEGLTKWVESGYRLLTSQGDAAAPFCSWRFWARGFGRESLVLGVVRVSSDSMGRPYPLLIMGSGPLEGWEGRWDLLPLAGEQSWCQIEYLATTTFGDLKKLETGLRTLRPPSAEWEELAARRQGLNRLGSPRDPYASFLDLRELERLAAEHGGTGELHVSLDRGPVNDKIILVSLWHHLIQTAAVGMPTALFMGGTLERSFLAPFRRPLAPGDFLHLWSASETGGWKNSIGTEYAMDIATLGREPVRPDQPVGQDVRYDPLFDTLQAEVDKLTSPAVAGSIDWEKVVRLAADILATRSKDLLVASYLAVGLVQTRGGDGLALGLTVWRDLLERFWADLYPTRMRGRQRSVEWWRDRTEVALRQMGELTLPPEQHAIVAENLEAVGRLLGEHLEDAPSLAPLREVVAAAAPETVPEEALPLSPAPAPGGEMPERDLPRSTTISAEAPRATLSTGSPAQAMEAGLRQVGEAAGALLQQDPASPAPYRLSRLAAWGTVAELPPAAGGRTRIPAPERPVRTFLQELASHGDSEALLKAAEGRLPQFIFWLDLNRFSAEALARLGERFAPAREAVCRETAALLQRLPGLDGLAFADGTPFADPATRQWLAGMAGHGATAGRSGTEQGEPVSRTAEIDREMGEAQALVRDGKLIDAVERLQKRLGTGASRQEKLIWRLALAELLVNANRTSLALPHLEQVIAEIGTFGLEEYDPSLALQGLKLAWLGFDAQAEPRFKEKAAETLHRIARLDPAEMVRLAKG